MMSATTELDPVLRVAVKMLHSSSTDSAEKIRMALDELIKQRCGAHKMLANTLPKKYLAEECLAPGSGAQPVQNISRRPSHQSIDSKASVSSSNMDNSPVHVTTITTDSGMGAGLVISVPDDDEEDDYMLTEEEHLRELEDLMCVVCRRMDVSARNRLIECAECHSLYHQECHKPAISDSDANEQEFSWCCYMCKSKMKASSAVASPAKSSSSHSSSSSSSSTSFQKIQAKSGETGVTIQAISITPSMPSLGAATTSSSSGSSHHIHHKSSSSKSSSSSSSSRHHHHSKSSSSSSHSTSGRDRDRDRGEAAASSSSSGKLSSSVTPSINIISADKRLANMKKKAAKMQESRRKHK